MTKQHIIIDNSAILRMLRAGTGLHQAQAANEAGLSTKTLIAAEAGPHTAKTHRKMLAVYAEKGLKLAMLPGLGGQPVPAILFDSDIAPKP